jgi:hypothetical protein
LPKLGDYLTLRGTTHSLRDYLSCKKSNGEIEREEVRLTTRLTPKIMDFIKLKEIHEQLINLKNTEFQEFAIPVKRNDEIHQLTLKSQEYLMELRLNSMEELKELTSISPRVAQIQDLHSKLSEQLLQLKGKQELLLALKELPPSLPMARLQVAKMKEDLANLSRERRVLLQIGS